MEGSKEAVESLLEWCGQGPRLSRVGKLDITRESYTGEYDSFEVTY
jgi:acylphosphatase